MSEAHVACKEFIPVILMPGNGNRVELLSHWKCVECDSKKVSRSYSDAVNHVDRWIPSSYEKSEAHLALNRVINVGTVNTRRPHMIVERVGELV